MRLTIPTMNPQLFAQHVLERMQIIAPYRQLDTNNGSMINLFAHSFASVLAVHLDEMLANLTFDEKTLTDVDLQTLESVWVALGEIIDRKRKEVSL